MPETSASNPDDNEPATALARGERRRISDPAMMRALSHPVRMEVWDFILGSRARGLDGVTATECAKAVGISPSAMSYHLRTLAKHGFIEEAPGRGDARERLWRPGLLRFSIGVEDDAPESDKLADQAMSEAFADQQDRHYRRYLDRAQELSHELRELALVTQGRLRLTLEEARGLQEAVMGAIEPYAAKSTERVEQGGGPEEALVMNYLFRFFPEGD